MAVQCRTASHGGPLLLWSTCTFSAQRQHETILTETDMAVSFPHPHPQSVANDYKYLTRTCNVHSNVQTECKMPHDFPAPLFSSPSRKLCSRETNCCVALALQWRMKVHRARQTSIPLQPPLSNKHIYYSGWARLEVSPHTPPTSCYPGQWDSGCATLGISTGTRKKKRKKTNGPPTFLSPTEESRAIATVYILEERVSSSVDVLWFFFFFLQPCWDYEQPPFLPSFFTTAMSMTSLPQRRSAQFIGSTVSQWLMGILIHWPHAASLLLPSLCATGDIFFLVYTGSSPGPHLTLWCVSYKFSHKNA